MNELNEIKSLFEKHFKLAPERVSTLQAAGSPRINARLFLYGSTYIGTYGNVKEENEAFLYLSETFAKAGLNVPEILAISKDRMCYIQSDLGTADLFQFLNTLQDNEHERALQLRKVIVELVNFQRSAHSLIDYSKCFPAESYDIQGAMGDFDYFKTYFLDAFSIPYDESNLLSAMESIAHKIGSYPHPTFMYRDFQSRNIIYSGGRYGFIDYQGGRQGPGIYDAISLIYQARLELSTSERNELIQFYLSQLDNTSSSIREDEKAIFPYMLWMRLIQVAGAYGRRGLLEKKPHFIDSMLPALKNFTEFKNENSDFLQIYPVIDQLLEEIKTNQARIIWKIQH